MFLKQIKIIGFKSFVDATNLYFSSNKIAVVGPNGCGKSNVIDAIRWVMGESSPKFLRGDMMADVIFNGSLHRKAQGMASVEIIFDNTNAYLNGAYVKQGDVALRREIYRDGESNYFINNQKVRRKDLTDLWLGTGAGARGYAIIGQNMVSQLVEASPEVLKNYLEEAAGVSKYKERRKESAQRLIQISDNLARIADIIGELSIAIERLAKEATDANHYQALRHKLQNLNDQLHMLQAQHVIKRYNIVAQQHNELVNKEQKLTSSMQKIEAQLANCNFDEKVNAVNLLEQNLYKIKLELAQQQDFYAKSKKTIEQISLEKLELEKNYQEEMHSLQNYEDDLAIMRNVQTEYDAQLVDNKDLMARLQINIREHRQLKNNAQQKIQKDMGQLEVLQAKQELNSQTLLQINDDIEQLSISNTNVERLAIEIANLHAQIIPAEQLLAAVEQENTSITAQVAVLNNEYQSLTRELTSCQKKADELNRQRAALESAYLGLLDSKIGSVLVDKPWQAINNWLLSWKVPNEWHRVIDYLWQFLPNFFSEQMTDKLRLPTGAYYAHMRPLKSSKQTLLSFMQVHSRPAGFINWEKIYVGDSLEELEALKEDESMLFAEGIWAGKHWIYYLPTNQKGLATRLNEWRVAEAKYLDHQHEVNLLEDKVNSVHVKRQQLSAQQVEIQQQLSAKIKVINDLKQQLTVSQNQYDFFLVERNKQLQQMQVAQEKQQQLVEQGNILCQEMLDIEVQISETQRQETELLTKLHKLQREYESLANQHDKVLNLSNENKVACACINTKYESIKQQLPKITTRLMHLESCLQEQPKLNALDALCAQKNLEIEHQSRLLTNEQIIVGALKNERMMFNQELEKLKQEHLQFVEKKWRILSEKEQIEPSFAAAINKYDQDLNAQVWQSLSGYNEQEIKKQIIAVEELLVKLGNVNLLAIGLYEQEQARLESLLAQENDLNLAVKDCETAIKTLDNEMQIALEKTLTEINRHLLEIFPQLFGGGQAKFVASCDNLLEATVEVQVQAPGKKQHKIQLLSGGEKALTAVALLFSIFSLNPAPFCLLDEVDAALDDANVLRLANLIDKLSCKVQFILITHNPLTMDVVHELIGVTMQEPGVSRVVTVNMATALDMINKE